MVMTIIDKLGYRAVIKSWKKVRQLYEGKTMQERNGVSLKLRTHTLDQEYYASAVIPYICAQRWHS